MLADFYCHSDSTDYLCLYPFLGYDFCFYSYCDLDFYSYFDLDLDLRATPFQLSVYQILGKIPYGEAISYTEVARRLGRPSAVRAVGAANGSNPLPLIVPCHRVVAADGQLQGYAGGVDLKARLLAMESATRPAVGQLF